MKNQLQKHFDSFWQEDGETGCWIWHGSKRANGYGQISFGQKNFLAHRMAVELYGTPIEDSMMVLHKCDVKACVNPDHLYVGTAADNNRDKLARGRGNNPRGEKHHNSKLDEAMVLAIRADSRKQHLIGKSYGISTGQVNRIKKRKEWSWL